jgi:sugar phosphate isomerase/epimerase
MSEKSAQLTFLNFMAGADIREALDRHVEWGIKTVDLKEAVFGKPIADLSDDEAVRLKNQLDERRLSVHCLSTVLFHLKVEEGESAFREKTLPKLERAIAVARILKASHLRLLSARIADRDRTPDSISYLTQSHPWIFGLYGEAVRRINEAGLGALIENETEGTIFYNPGEFLSFFKQVKAGPGLKAIWDIQNLWQCGTPPTLQVYQRLKPIIGAVHVKGGIADGLGKLQYASALEEASWPVVEILKQVIQDKTSPVICLNPSHGKQRPGYDSRDVLIRDIAFLRKTFKEIE